MEAEEAAKADADMPSEAGSDDENKFYDKKKKRKREEVEERPPTPTEGFFCFFLSLYHATLLQSYVKENQNGMKDKGRKWRNEDVGRWKIQHKTYGITTYVYVL